MSFLNKCKCTKYWKRDKGEKEEEGYNWIPVTFSYYYFFINYFSKKIINVQNCCSRKLTPRRYLKSSLSATATSASIFRAELKCWIIWIWSKQAYKIGFKFGVEDQAQAASYYEEIYLGQHFSSGHILRGSHHEKLKRQPFMSVWCFLKLHAQAAGFFFSYFLRSFYLYFYIYMSVNSFFFHMTNKIEIHAHCYVYFVNDVDSNV